MEVDVIIGRAAAADDRRIRPIMVIEKAPRVVTTAAMNYWIVMR